MGNYLFKSSDRGLRPTSSLRRKTAH